MDGLAALAGLPASGDSDLQQRLAAMEKERQDLKNGMSLQIT